MAFNDSMDKVVKTYFKAFTTAPFEYKGAVVEPMTTFLSPTLARKLLCLANCAGCCSVRFSLDWLPYEDCELDPDLTARTVMGKSVFTVFQAPAKPGEDRFCKNVDHSTGFCKIHGKHPFSCDFETVRIKHWESQNKAVVGVGPYGRGWQLMKVDGTRGALCQHIDGEGVEESLRKLIRLKGWMDYFNIGNKVNSAIDYLNDGQWKNGLKLAS